MNTKKFGLEMLAVIAGAVLLAQVVPAGAETVTFKQYNTNPFTTGDYMGTEDNALYNGAGDNSYSTSNLIDAGPYSTTQLKRSVIRFDLSDFAGEYATISSVTLRLYVNYSAFVTFDNTLQVYAITENNAGWVEGTVNGRTEEGSSCWNYLAYSSTSPTDWDGGAGLGNPGDGYDATPLATATVTSSLAANSALDLTFSGTSAALTALIDSFTDPDTNAGVLLRTADETSGRSMIRFYASDGNPVSVEQTYAPELVIDYAVPEPATMAMLGLGGMMMLVRRRRK